jgi:hypothetical protein
MVNQTGEQKLATSLHVLSLPIDELDDGRQADDTKADEGTDDAPNDTQSDSKLETTREVGIGCW